MGIKFKNNATGELASGIADNSLSITLKTGQGDRFPAVSTDYFYITLEDVNGNKEICKCTSRTAGSNTLTIERAQEGTTARAFLADSKVELRLTAGVVQGAIDDIVSQQSTLSAHAGATGTGVHGLGTMSTQAASSVAITGGSAALDNEASSRKIKARDHGTSTDPEVVNVVYGTGSPPSASSVPIGTLFVKYI